MLSTQHLISCRATQGGGNDHPRLLIRSLRSERSSSSKLKLPSFVLQSWGHGLGQVLSLCTRSHQWCDDLQLEVDGWAGPLLLGAAGTSSEPQIPLQNTDPPSPAGGFEGCQRSPVQPSACPDTSQGFTCLSDTSSSMKAFPQGPSSIPWEMLPEQGHPPTTKPSISNSPASVSTHTSPLSLSFFLWIFFSFLNSFIELQPKYPIIHLFKVYN